MATIIWITFLAIAVLGRVLIQYRMTGDHGIRPAKRISNVATKISSSLFILSFLAITILVLLDELGLLIASTPNQNWSHLFGLALSLFGLLVIVTSQYQMGASWRLGLDQNETTKLVTTGLYSYVRNPIYSGVIIFCVGLFAILPSVYMLVACLVGYISLEMQVRQQEEPYLKKIHGEKYEEYLRTTGRYFPNF